MVQGYFLCLLSPAGKFLEPKYTPLEWSMGYTHSKYKMSCDYLVGRRC